MTGKRKGCNDKFLDNIEDEGLKESIKRWNTIYTKAIKMNNYIVAIKAQENIDKICALARKDKINIPIDQIKQAFYLFSNSIKGIIEEHIEDQLKLIECQNKIIELEYKFFEVKEEENND